MAATQRRTIFLTGAPETESLSWDEEHLLSELKPPFTARLDERTSTPGQPLLSSSTPTGHFAKWRSVDYHSPATKILLAKEDAFQPTQFLPFNNDRAAGALKDEDDTGFLEHSVAVLDGIDSSQVLPKTSEDYLDAEQTTFVSTDSFATNSLTESSFQTTNASFLSAYSPEKTGNLQDILDSCPITDLKHIPNATHITHLHPQTITLNLLVGIISISPARTVPLRRRTAEMDIIEITVGDDTRAGFGVSFWLTPLDSQHKPADDLRGALKALRTGDVVLVRNVALSCFRGCVYGQSLSRRFARNSTMVMVLREVDLGGESAAFGAKVQRVRRWTRDFVGVREPASFDRVWEGRKGDELPPDTQE
ncbi:hypothetical protein LTR37_000792 [Vermiconidia calcicola]|uniref:Uncharacterized protein n=1 Tax=Vermiconidia calcicola TaxID=1690605 RepID=A0ACC3NXC1_9PEZI|nr:hypothetical protein LTR37_000792 [Vermiconidia calcicola]